MLQVTKILLTNFRNFSSKKIKFSKSLVLFVGKNGVGKTNILEGLTLFGRNSSLRGADFEEMILNSSLEKKFTIYSEISNHEFIEKIALSFDLNSKKKVLQINEEIINGKRQSDIRGYLINFI